MDSKERSHLWADFQNNVFVYNNEAGTGANRMAVMLKRMVIKAWQVCPEYETPEDVLNTVRELINKTTKERVIE